jgi:predicted ATPase
MEKNAPILTPDQRLRVFVSSTLQELAEERSSVKQAIQNLHLIPVMFEMGARPHAPRNLYRQYLAQSQIFIGIYWERYGWIAPEENISGLEDEYNLSGNLPKLIYIKKSSGNREERLTELLRRIEKDDKVSYKTFENAGELEGLIVNDLALLLTERFNLTIQNKISESEYKPFNSLPSIPNALIGREKNLEEITALLKQPETRLVTLTGPGGIGKTRLGIEAARQLQSSYPDGAGYVPLAPVKDHTLVAETVCYTLGIKVSGGNILDSLKLFLQDKKFLLLLDNFEQVIEAASIIDDLLLASPGLKIIVTSRERLSLSFEHIYIVPTLPDAYGNAISQNEYPAAVELFIQRARATQSSFKVTDQNRDIIFKICHRLEGLPLAIELAAGQINLFSPSLLLQKLDHRLDVLKVNLRDMPDRQKTIRNTIEWSFELLSPEEQNVLLHISLYNAGCLLSTLEKIFSTSENIEVYEVISSLINKSLLMKQDEDFQVRFQVLESVREFAYEKLRGQDLLRVMQQAQADYYFESLDGIKLQKNKIDQVGILKFLEKEHPNIRQALDFLMQKKDVRKVTMIAWNLWLFWWVNAHTNEGYTWVKKAWEMHNSSDEQLDEYTFSVLACNVGLMAFLQRDFPVFNETMYKHLDLISKQDDDELVATSTMITGVVLTIMKQYEKAEYMLQIGLERFKKTGLNTGISLALSALGRNSIYKGGGIAEAKEYYRKSMALAKQDHNEISVIICLSGFALCEVMEKNSDAKNYLRESILLSQSLHFYEAFAWSMEIWALVSINEGKFLHAVTLMGAVDHLRNTTQMPVWEDLQAVIVEAKNGIKQQMDPAVFTAAWNDGAAMSLDKMVTFAMEEKEEVVAEAMVMEAA